MKANGCSACDDKAKETRRLKKTITEQRDSLKSIIHILLEALGSGQKIIKGLGNPPEHTQKAIKGVVPGV